MVQCNCPQLLAFLDYLQEISYFVCDVADGATPERARENKAVRPEPQHRASGERGNKRGRKRCR
jgi:hypothetical protein